MRPLNQSLLGVFADPERAAAAIRALRESGAADVRAAMPAAFSVVVEALGRPRSRLGLVVLVAALAGTAGGFALCVATSIAWPLVTGGKAIISVPPFVIVAFELSVLIGGIVNLITLGVFSIRARRRRAVPGYTHFSGDRIGVFVAGGGSDAEAVLRAHGAEEVARVA